MTDRNENNDHLSLSDYKSIEHFSDIMDQMDDKSITKAWLFLCQHFDASESHNKCFSLLTELID